MAKVTLYFYETGVLFDKDHMEFDYYNKVYNKKYGFYDEEYGWTKNEDKAKEIVNDYVKNGVPNTYGVVLKYEYDEEDIVDIVGGTFNDITDDDLIEFNNEDVDYDMENVVYSVAKNKEKTFENFLVNGYTF